MTQRPAYHHGYILGISFISALGGYLFGFDFAVISGALPFLRNVFALTTWWEGFLTGSLALGCMAGCLLAGGLADRYGRRIGLMIAALLFACSSLGMGLAHSFPVFIATRTAAGVGVGMASMLSPLYIAEISPAAVRGRNVAINQLTIVLGILITNLVNYFLAAHGAEAWRWMFALGVVPSGLFLLGVLWLPESPRWLMLSGRQEQALKVLSRIGDANFVRQTAADITSSTIERRTVKLKDIFSGAVRPAVIVGITLAVFQQFCGINVVFNYTSTIFRSIGADLDRQLLETISIGAVNFIFTLVAMWQVDKWGRKPLMLLGSAGLAIVYIALALSLQGHAPTGIVSLCVLAAIALYATSLAPVTWVLISEIFPTGVRGKATSMAVVSLWAAYFVLAFTFPVLAAKLGTFGPFYLYAGVCLLGFLFVRSRVKETKGKTLEEIEGSLIRH
jgi:sugar porter (SP) family MFS transporter